MDDVRAAAATKPTQQATDELLTSYGLKDQGSIYKDLLVDEFDVLPHDPFHLWVMGLLSLFLSIFA